MIVAIALGELEHLLQSDIAHLILTDELKELVLETDWSRPEPEFSLLRDIYRLLNQWFLQTHSRLVEVDVSGVEDYQPHPVPVGSENQGLVEFWSHGTGKLLKLHDDCFDGNRFFIGVICENSFAGDEKGAYQNEENERAFPLVGPNDVNWLEDAYIWDVGPDIHQKNVGFESAKKNVEHLGGTFDRVRGDHYVFVFEGARSWPLTRSDPVPENHLAQLGEITGYPKPVIRYVLINGAFPRQVVRFEAPTS